jgi:hypothetical protein
MTEQSVEKAECGEVFYGWAPKGQWHLDYSVPRWCDLAAGHPGTHDWSGPSSTPVTPDAERPTEGEVG